MWWSGPTIPLRRARTGSAGPNVRSGQVRSFAVEQHMERIGEGVWLSCRSWGSGDLVVLLHGLGESSATWTEVGPALAESGDGRRVVAVDLRGHGQSDRPGVYSHATMAADVRALWQGWGSPPVMIVGHSLGGVVACLVAASMGDRVVRLVMEDVAPPRTGRTRRPIPDRPTHEVPFDWPVVPAILSEINDPDPAWWSALGHVTAPTLIVGGGPSSTVDQRELVAAAQAINDSTVVTIDAGHHVHAIQPAAFITAVDGFLDPT